MSYCVDCNKITKGYYRCYNCNIKFKENKKTLDEMKVFLSKIKNEKKIDTTKKIFNIEKPINYVEKTENKNYNESMRDAKQGFSGSQRRGSWFGGCSWDD